MALTRSLNLTGALNAGGKGLSIKESPSLILDSASGNLENRPLVNFTRSSVKQYFDANGLMQEAPVDQLPVSFDPANGSRLGWLIEESRTNEIKSFEDGGFNGNSDFSYDKDVAEAPDGTTSANRVTRTDSGSNVVTTTDPAPASNITCSVFIKFDGVATGTLNFLIRNGSTSTNLESGVCEFDADGNFSKSGDLNSKYYGNGWYRVWLVQSGSITAGDTITFYFGSTSGGLALDASYLVWGFQMEDGLFPTSPIITSGSAVTRSADVADITDLSFYNQDEGTFVIEHNNYVLDKNSGLLEIKKSSSSGENLIFRVSDIGNYNIIVPSVANKDSGIASNSNQNNAVFSYSGIGGRNIKVSVNGSSVFSSDLGSSSDYAGANSLTIGYWSSKTANFLNGYIKSLKYYPKALTDAQLQTLTS